MRFLVIIPAFILFLSNMPFTHEMPMEAKMAKTDKEPACSMMQTGEQVERSCMPGKKPFVDESTGKGCCKHDETTNSTCICIFAYTAPVNDIRIFQLDAVDDMHSQTGYLQLIWKDPHIASPGQPPDFA